MTFSPLILQAGSPVEALARAVREFRVDARAPCAVTRTRCENRDTYTSNGMPLCFYRVSYEGIRP